MINIDTDKIIDNLAEVTEFVEFAIKMAGIVLLPVIFGFAVTALK